MKEKVPASDIEEYFERLWPICRSISGNGLRQSLSILSELLPLNMHEVPTGTAVFDWVVPKEWNVSDAYIITPDGRKICDFKRNNLHLVGYSRPVHISVDFETLREHLHSLPRLPKAVPYVTSYYKENWGFCISDEELAELPHEGLYEVFIDSELSNGSITYADCILKGSSEQEILFSTYLCHPSMANNELSGPLVLSFLFDQIKKLPNRRFTYRFVIAPETIGTISYLAANGESLLKNVFAGFVLTCCGTDAPLVYKRSRRGNSSVDLMVEHSLNHSGRQYRTIDFEPVGSDERQYCSPAFNLPVGSLMTSKYHEYPEYHSSFDNKSLISFDAMSELIEFYVKIVRGFEANQTFVNTVGFCEPNLGKRGLYQNLGGAMVMPDQLLLRMRMLNFMDGTKSLLDFCTRYNMSILDIQNEVEILYAAGLLAIVNG